MNLRILQHGIQERQQELHRIAGILATAAQTGGRRAAIGKVLVIVLGAFVATQAVAAKLWGDTNMYITIIYTLAGLLIAAVTGVEAAFKTESRSSALKALATRCQITIFQIDTQWQKSVGWYQEASGDSAIEDGRIKAAQALLEMQDQTLNDAASKATELGVNVAYEVRQLYHGDAPAMA